MRIQPLTLRIEKKTWDKFCRLLPDTRTKNGTIVELIEGYINENKN